MHDDYELNLHELDKKDGSFIAHHYNIQKLCIGLYEVYHNLSQTIFSELFSYYGPIICSLYIYIYIYIHIYVYIYMYVYICISIYI